MLPINVLHFEMLWDVFTRGSRGTSCYTRKNRMGLSMDVLGSAPVLVGFGTRGQLEMVTN